MLKDPKHICRVVSYPVWDFVEFSHYILPELHVEIILLNNALDNIMIKLKIMLKLHHYRKSCAETSLFYLIQRYPKLFQRWRIGKL
jgi:hypothetical protein